MSDVESMSWRDLSILRPKAMTTLKVIFIILLLDVAVSLALSFVLGDDFYLKKYFLPPNYDQLMTDYNNDAYYIRPHKGAGWINAPYLRIEKDKWFTDSLGSRVSSHNGEEGESLLDENLVFMLGSSVVNGFGLPNEETIASLLNQKGHRALNFGVYMYSIDQSLGWYQDRLSQLKPKVLIVGFHKEADTVSNMFGSFRNFIEIDMHAHFLKPSYHLSEGQLIKAEPPYQHQRDKNFSLVLSELEKHDADYSRFKAYNRLSLLPFSNFLQKVLFVLKRKLYDVDEYTHAVELQKRIMQEIVNLASQDGTEVIFLQLPSQYDLEHSFLNQIFYQYFYKNKTEVQMQLMKQSPFNIIYTSELFKEVDKPLWNFYLEDQTHFSKVANVLLAERLNQEINKIQDGL